MMRKTLTALFIAATLPTAMVIAAPGEDGPKDRHEGFEHHGPRGEQGGRGEHGFKGGPLEKLDLSKEQKQQIQKLKVEEMKAKRDITQRYLDKLPEAERKAMEKDLQDSRAKTHKAVRDLLKPEQQKELDELHKKMEEKHKEREAFLKWKAEQEKAAPAKQ